MRPRDARNRSRPRHTAPTPGRGRRAALGAGLHRRIHLAGGIVGMRAQHMPEPFDHSWPAGMNMPVPVGVIGAAVASLRIAHDAQDARRIRLQHLNNNHANATAKDSQPPCPGIAAHTS